jgi:LSD1 subclass zinc finger protein
VYVGVSCAAPDMAQLVCNGSNCRMVLMYPRGAMQVQCSLCHTINNATRVMTFCQGPNSLFCRAPHPPFCPPRTARHVRLAAVQLQCSPCHTINNATQMMMFCRGPHSLFCPPRTARYVRLAAVQVQCAVDIRFSRRFGSTSTPSN